MEAVIRYVAEDGKEFVCERDCVNHEKLVEEVESLLDVLGSRDFNNVTKTTLFSTGSGYIQHDLLNLRSVKECFYKLIGKTGEEHPTCFHIAVIEKGLTSLKDLWFRLQCVDEDGKEFSQPFHMLNQINALKQLNDRERLKR